MGKGAKGGGNKKSRRLEELQAALEAAPEPEASAESKPGPQTEEEKRAAEETEAQFMAALAREIGVPQEELTDEAVRAAMAKLSPAQLQKLAEEGKALKAELHSRPDDYSDEIEVFRDELNKRAEASDLPVEKDGEHLGKKIVAYMEGSSEPMPYLVLLEAVASTPYLVKLALAEAREKAAVADRADLDAIESELARLKVPGWRASDPEREGRPPFVRRNLLLVYFHMYASAIRALELDNGTKRACGEIMGKVARLLDMLFQYSLKNRWIKAALTITELQVRRRRAIRRNSAQFSDASGNCASPTTTTSAPTATSSATATLTTPTTSTSQGLITNGLWSHTEDECRELMKQRLGAAGLKVPKLFLTVAARDVLPGETVSIKVEVSRLHVYTDDELDELKRLHITELPAAEAEAPAAEEAAAEGGGGGGKGDKKEEEQQPQEGWWVIGESIRKSLTATQSAGGKTTTIQAEEVRRAAHLPIHTSQFAAIHTSIPTPLSDHPIHTSCPPTPR